MKTKERELLEKILTSENITEGINTNLGELTAIIPEISNMFGFEHQHPHHHLDVWKHTLLALSKAPNNFDIRLSLLLHDIGKPHSYQNDGGIRHFKGHPEKSATISETILNRLGFNQEYREYICTAINHHDTALTSQEIISNPVLSNLIFEIQKCDAHAHNPKYNKKRLQYLQDTTNLFNQLSISQEYTQEFGITMSLSELI